MKKKKLTASDILTTVILCILTILFIFPFYWIMTGAFKAQADTIMVPPQWWPKAPTIENFKALVIQNPALKWLWNSVFISVVTMFLVCGTSSLAGYALAKSGFMDSRFCFDFYCCHGLAKTGCSCPSCADC